MNYSLNFRRNCTIEKVNIEENIDKIIGQITTKKIEAEKFYKLSPPENGYLFEPKIIYAPIKDLVNAVGGSKQKTRKNHRRNQIAENQIAENQIAENQIAENQIAENQIAENQIAENQIVVANSLISLLNNLVNLFVKYTIVHS